MKIEFSPEGYAAVVGALRQQGYVHRHYVDANPSSRDLIVRHDVDFSLEDASAMAELEKGLRLSSTYFVLLASEFYNPRSRRGLAALRNILSCGHDVGLHFDAEVCAGDAAMEDAIESECRALEGLLGRPVTVISFHRPAPGLVGSRERLAGRLNAYSPRFIKEMGYCSDSRGAWHHGEPLDHPAVRQGTALQLLIHPFWWQAPEQSPEERLAAFLKKRSVFLDRELAHHCTVHRAGG